MHDAVSVRSAAIDDLKTIVDFNARMARETENLELDRAVLTRGVRAALMDPHKALYFVAETDGSIVGQLMITREWSDWRDGDIWWIQSVYVAEPARRGGVFRALFTHVEGLARRQGVVAVRLYVEHRNAVAQATYERLGMHRSHYVIMEKPLA
jgi:ribosomal protein S18 acetylase RimI-like enzyme